MAAVVEMAGAGGELAEYLATHQPDWLVMFRDGAVICKRPAAPSER